MALTWARFRLRDEGAQRFIAGWSSPVARQAHNLKVIGSNPIPATRQEPVNAMLAGFFRRQMPVLASTGQLTDRVTITLRTLWQTDLLTTLGTPDPPNVAKFLTICDQI